MPHPTLTYRRCVLSHKHLQIQSFHADRQILPEMKWTYSLKEGQIDRLHITRPQRRRRDATSK